MSSSILKACDFCGLERAKAGAFGYGKDKGWSLRLRKRAKAGAFAYGRGQRLEPSLTEEGKGWSLRLRDPVARISGEAAASYPN
jgi:hypothetical protein